MADVYAQLIPVVSRLMAAYGTPDCRITRAESAADPSRPWRATDADDLTVAEGFRAVLGEGMMRRGANGAPAMTVSGQGAAYASGADLSTCLPGDVLEIGTDRYVIDVATPIKPGGTTVAWVLKLRS